MAPKAVAILNKPAKVERFPALGIFAPPPIEVASTEYSGSLGVLLQLVQDHKIDLVRVPLLPVCEAYFAYILQTNKHNLDDAAAALLALAYLLERKSWMLLPGPDEEPEFEAPFEMPDPTVGEFSLAIQSLRVWQEEREQFFFRPLDAGPDPYEVPVELSDVSAGDLARAFERLLRRAVPEPLEPLTKKRRSLTDQMGVAMAALTKDWRTMEELIPDPFTREDAVYWFLSLLELIRLGQAKVRLEGEDVQFARAR
jgi:segregation and condensation protein A